MRANGGFWKRQRGFLPDAWPTRDELAMLGEYEPPARAVGGAVYEGLGAQWRTPDPGPLDRVLAPQPRPRRSLPLALRASALGYPPGLPIYLGLSACKILGIPLVQEPGAAVRRVPASWVLRKAGGGR